MTTQSMVRPPFKDQDSSIKTKVAISLVSGIVLFLVITIIAVLVFEFLYLGYIFPGVTVANVDLSNIRRTQAPGWIEQHLSYPNTGLIVFRDGESIWTFTPAQLGLVLDSAASGEEAFKIGRSGWPWTRLNQQLQVWRNGIDLPPKFTFDGQVAQSVLEGIAAQINQETVEASLTVEGLDVMVAAGQVGRTLDVWTTIGLLSVQLTALQDAEIPVVVHESRPAILDVSAHAEVARTILSAPMTLTIPGGGQNDPDPWTFEPEVLADMLTIERVNNDGGETYQVGLHEGQLRSFLVFIQSDLVLEPKNARFYFDDDTRELVLIESAIIGRGLDVEASITQINQQITSGIHSIDLVFNLTPPAVTNETTAADLGITELVSAETTYFYGSSAGRIQNIQTGAAQFHGLFIAPGETFSMVEHLGDISLNSGYAESLIIFGNRTIAGVGGGICQVSTTLFRTVFFGGYPVEERYSHAYRVYYYELNSGGGINRAMAGLDATIYTPLVDFKFTNDSPSWILMETYVYPGARSLTWKFYSTSDGRQVEWDSSGLQNIVEPPEPVFEENENLAKGEIEQVDWAVEGADVSITRTVTINGQILFIDQFNTHYDSWAMVCQYGPGTNNYPPEEIGEDFDSCRP
ncbi:MAG: hypothetical protein FVQ83_14510 [Chloroflexi bacterium]|nr:hypothetical protein [Chloroflexota bacterium]